ncbi:MAG TPA: hypothetical protein VLE74_03065 [Candidatus Saccharimonadales bacterium]|nr:hypothetical protein [Candidatus Saccharimonadales bacterium]
MMANTYWHKQTAGTPLFPELSWSRPQNKAHAGKLLIIGGNAYGFAAPAEAYQATLAAGVGSIRILLPTAVKKIAGSLLPGVEYAPSTPSGSFAKTSLADCLEHAVWADGVLLAGDVGHNSETAILIESFLAKYQGQVTVTKDAAEYLIGLPKFALQRQDTLLVITMAQLQKLARMASSTTAFTYDMDLVRLVDALHDFTSHHAASVIVKHLDRVIVAVTGQISTTSLGDTVVWRVRTAATAAVWWLQNPSKPFEAITTAVSPQE